jgi:hypothetical protein
LHAMKALEIVRMLMTMKTRQVEPIQCEECRGQGSFVPSFHAYTVTGSAAHIPCEKCGMDGAPVGKQWPTCSGKTNIPNPVYPKIMRRCRDVVDGESCADCWEIDERVLCPVCAADPSQHVCDLNPEMRGQP